jgi:DNA-binding NtrC family response regulator
MKLDLGLGDGHRMAPHGSRVLLIDDSRTARATLARALEDAGFETATVGDAAAALDALAQRHFYVVVADYQLPGVTGLELLAILRGEDPGRPLILYSGSMTPDIAAQARDFRVTAMLRSPVSPAMLVAAVRAALQPKTLA